MCFSSYGYWWLYKHRKYQGYPRNTIESVVWSRKVKTVSSQSWYITDVAYCTGYRYSTCMPVDIIYCLTQFVIFLHFKPLYYSQGIILVSISIICFRSYGHKNSYWMTIFYTLTAYANSWNVVLEKIHQLHYKKYNIYSFTFQF